MAGSGDRLLQLAAEQADIVALGLPPQAGEDALAAKAARLRELAGERFDQIELNVNLLAIGDETPPWLRQYIGADVAELAAQGSAAVLTGSVEQMVRHPGTPPGDLRDQLRRDQRRLHDGAGPGRRVLAGR